MADHRKQVSEGIMWSNMDGGRRDLNELLLPPVQRKSELSTLTKVILAICVITMSGILFCTLYSILFTKTYHIRSDNPVLHKMQLEESLKLRSLRSTETEKTENLKNDNNAYQYYPRKQKRSTYMFVNKFGKEEEISIDPNGLVEFHTLTLESPYLSYSAQEWRVSKIFKNYLSDDILGRTSSDELRGIYIRCEDFFKNETVQWTKLDYFQKIFNRCQKAGAITEELQEKFRTLINPPTNELSSDIYFGRLIKCTALDSYSESDSSWVNATGYHPLDICYKYGITIDDFNKNITKAERSIFSERGVTALLVDIDSLYIDADVLFSNIHFKYATKKMKSIYDKFKNFGAIDKSVQSNIEAMFENQSFVFSNSLGNKEKIAINPNQLVEFSTLLHESPYLLYALQHKHVENLFRNYLSDATLGRKTEDEAFKESLNNKGYMPFRGVYITCNEFFFHEDEQWRSLHYLQKIWKRCLNAGAISRHLLNMIEERVARNAKRNKMINSGRGRPFLRTDHLTEKVIYDKWVVCTDLDSYSESDPAWIRASNHHPFDICYQNALSKNDIWSGLKKGNNSLYEEMSPFSSFANMYIHGEVLFTQINSEQATDKMRKIYEKVKAAGAVSKSAQLAIESKLWNS